MLNQNAGVPVGMPAPTDRASVGAGSMAVDPDELHATASAMRRIADDLEGLDPRQLDIDAAQVGDEQLAATLAASAEQRQAHVREVVGELRRHAEQLELTARTAQHADLDAAAGFQAAPERSP